MAGAQTKHGSHILPVWIYFSVAGALLVLTGITVAVASVDLGDWNIDIALTVGGQAMNFKGQTYLVNFVMPNFYFHVTTAYDILRHCGLHVGKRDFMGQV